MRASFIPFIFALALLTQACGDQSVTVTCTDDTTYFHEGECVPKPVPCGGCEAPTPVCDDASDTCVGCLQNTDCQDPTASLCDDNHSCQPCGADTDCAHLGDLNLCLNGRCGECTIETEAAHCGDNSCNPATLECTQTERGSIPTCGKCVADSECASTHRCIPMNFKDTARDSAYCLEVAPEGACPQPFKVAIEATSLSGAEEDVYCGINQDLTTCEAVNDGRVSTDCDDDTNCGVEGLDDGLCRDFGGVIGFICTYECDAPTQCLDGYQCNTTGTPDFCDDPT